MTSPVSHMAGTGFAIRFICLQHVSIPLLPQVASVSFQSVETSWGMCAFLAWKGKVCTKTEGISILFCKMGPDSLLQALAGLREEGAWAQRPSSPLGKATHGEMAPPLCPSSPWPFDLTLFGQWWREYADHMDASYLWSWDRENK